MKILCISQRFYPSVGGAEQVAKNYMDFLSENHEITVYTTNASDLNSFWNERAKKIVNPISLNYKIKRYEILPAQKIPKEFHVFPFTISSPGPFCPDLWKDLLNLKENFDLIIATTFPYDHIIPAFLASKKFGIPLIIIPHLHLEFPHLYLTSLKLSMLSEATTIVVNTEEEKNTLIKYSLEGDKIHIIPPGIDIKKHSHELQNIRKKLGISQNSLLVLFAGRKSPEKGIIHLIEAMKMFWNENKSIELIIIGQSTKEFEFYISKQDPKIKKRIFDFGTVSDDEKWSIFNSCDIFAMPSKSESFGITYLEAWLYKKPVIACDISVIRNVIDDQENGILVRFGDKKQLHDVIEVLFDSELRRQIGENGYQKLIQKYDSKKLCQNFEDLCIKIVSN